MNSQNLNLRALINGLAVQLGNLKKYSYTAFLLFIVLLYSFVLLKINGYQNTEPSENDISSQIQAARIPHIDDGLVQQIKSLQDNSVSVQTLFNEARNNPF